QREVTTSPVPKMNLKNRYIKNEFKNFEFKYDK
ncbi:MAG: hypothetical protein RLZ13_366, partial [Bacteroidota bacterium]